ncbi:MAG TPA: lipid A biosynthesis acyltransferase [Gammaproteobacteria bacterium]|nr:lipid A biosynthesis acyltransferase [Gammaproteobacteria bacterium]
MLQFLLTLYARTPLGAAQRLGRFIGWIAWAFHLRERHTAKVNIALCFPEMPPHQQQQLVKQTLVENGKLMAELPITWLRPFSEFESGVDVREFRRHLAEKHKQGKGLIVAVPHMGNWELGLHAVVSVAPTTVLYRPPRKKWLEEIMTRGRTSTGAVLVPATGSGIKELVAALKRNEIIIILPDQIPKQLQNAGGLYSPFFGHPAMTMTLLSKLAAKTEAPVVLAVVKRLPQGESFLGQILDAEPAVNDPDLEVSVGALNKTIEKAVLEVPAQYQWVYRRFHEKVYSK